MKANKLDALDYVLVALDRDLKKLQGTPLPWEPTATIPVIEQLDALRAEVLAHRESLGYAHLACTMGQEGAIPAGWDEWSGGQPFDHHAVAVDALVSAPNTGQLSIALLTYLDELPSRLQRAHDNWVAYARADTTLLPNNIMKQFTEQQVGRQSMAEITKHLESTAFAESYTADLAHALELARQRSDWDTILAYLA